MAGRNRMNYGRDHNSARYDGYPYGSSGPPPPFPYRDPGLGGIDASRRGQDQDPHLSRRLAGPPYAVVDPRFIPGRGGPGVVDVGDGRVESGGRGVFPLPPPEAPILSNQQFMNAGANRLAYEQGGLIGPGAVGPHFQHPVPMRGLGGVVGGNNYSNVEGYGLLQQQPFQLADGSLRTMYSVPELGGSSLPGEIVGKGMGGFRGGYVGSDAAAAHDQKLLQQGLYQERQILRDGRMLNVRGWGEDVPVELPLSPRAMPMSPRRDDLVRMMSPRRDDLSPTIPMSPRRDEITQMMSPRREHISPPRSPRRREYPPALDYGGRSQYRRGLSPSREEDFLLQRPDFPMSPRRGAPLTPPRSPRGGWYEGPPLSPPRMAAPMSPRYESPTRSPVWGSSRHFAKAPSQWDVRPGKRNLWHASGEREPRRESRHDHLRGRGRVSGYGADIDDARRPGQRWHLSRKGEGRLGRREDEEDVYFRVGRSYEDQQPRHYGMASDKPTAYNSVVNQRVGLVTKYIERERAERAAKEATERNGKESGRMKLTEDRRPPTDNNRPPRFERRNEKDTLAAAIAKTAASNAKVAPNSGKRTSKPDESNLEAGAATCKSVPATLTTNSDRTGGGEKTSTSKPFNAIAAETSATANGIAEGASSGQPSTTQGIKSTNTADFGGAAAEDAPQKTEVTGNSADNNERQTNGPCSKPVNGIANAVSKPGGDDQKEPVTKRPSLVMEIERAKKSRKLAEQQKHANIREVEETYYDANELSADFVTKMNRAGSRYSRMINDDHFLKTRYQGGGQGDLHCLVCGKGSKTFSDVYELVTHAQHSQVQSKRIDHMGFRKALIDVLKLDIKDRPVSNIKMEEDQIVWPPVVVVENARTGLGADKRWEGVTNSEMSLLLNDLGHLHGRAKSIWDKFGHRGIVHVQFEPSLEGLEEAERLHNYFLQNGRGRVQWDIIRPFKTGLPGFETIPDGPDFTRFDEVTKTNQRVLYGYVALKKDVEKIFGKKQRKKVQIVGRIAVKAKFIARQSGEQVVI